MLVTPEAARIRPSLAADLPAVELLLEQASLPLEGVREHFGGFLVAESGGSVVGAIGVEPYGDTGLLRSLVVEPACRGTGIGGALVEALVRRAGEQGVRRMILLTTTAAGFFASRGFQRVDRSAVSGPVTGSIEFVSACPASAAVMELHLPLRILVLCTGNSCRSQMAEAFLRSFDPSLDVRSAGTAPALAVHPIAVQVMREAGIPLEGARPKSVEEFLGQAFDWVITVCDHANETCPLFTGAVRSRVHMGFEDPAGAQGSDEEVLRAFRRVRDEIRDGFRGFFRDRLSSPRDAGSPR
jgi:arsenate reductase